MIAAVILNWNGWADTHRCLRSLAVLRPAPGAQLMVDLDGTSVTLPVVGGPAALQSALGMH